MPTIEEVLSDYQPLGTQVEATALPSTVNPGELMLLFYGIAFGAAPAIAPTGWTEGFLYEEGGYYLQCYYKSAVGDEDGTTIDLDRGTVNRDTVTQIYRISGWNSISFGTPADASNTSPNPPSVTANSVDDNLFIPVTLVANEVEATGAPTDYTNLTTNATSDPDDASDGVSLNTARRALNADTEDPGAFTLPSSNFWIVNTIAIENGSSDTTDPTPGNSGTFDAATNLDQNSFTANWTEGTDDTTSTANLLNYIYISLSDNIDTVSNAEANGTLVNAGGTAGIDTLAVDCTLLGSFTPGDRVYYNNVIEDEAENKAAYTSTSVVTQAVYGNIKDGGANDTEGIAHIYTLPEDTDPTAAPTRIESASADGSGNYIMSTQYDRTLHYMIFSGYWEVVYSGTTDSGTASSLTDTGAFTANEFDGGGYAMRTVGGSSSGKTRQITGNANTDTFNFTPDVSPAIDGTTQYEVVQWQADEPKLLLRKE